MLARLLNNWPYKLLALVIAIVLRVQVGNAQNPQQNKQITVPITVNQSDVPSKYVETSCTQTVTVTFSGSPEDIANLSASDVQARVDLSKAHGGGNTGVPIVVTLSNQLRDKVQRESMSPGSASVYLDPKQDMVLSVHADPPPAPVGYIYDTAVVAPTTATVEGPESVVKNISQLVVFLAGDSAATATRIDDVGKIVAVDATNTPVDSNLLTLTPSQARVQIPIRKVGLLKSLVISAQVTGSPRYPLRVSKVDVDPEMVVVSGPAMLLTQTSVALTMPVDVTNQTDTFRQSVKLDLPAGLTAVQNPVIMVTVHLTSAPPVLQPNLGLASHDTHANAIQ